MEKTQEKEFRAVCVIEDISPEIPGAKRMKDTEFNLLDPIAEAISTIFVKLLKAGEFEGITRKLG